MIRCPRLKRSNPAIVSGARTREVLCPASEEAGKRTQCIRCLLCAGAETQAKSVAIVVHGAGRKHHTAAAG